MSTAPDDKLLCYCKNVRYGEVRRCIEEISARTHQQVTAHCDAGGGCKTCVPEIEALLEEHRNKRRSRGCLGFLKKLIFRT